MIVLDVEIARAIPPRDGQRLSGIEYCEGWRDFRNMGLACVCTYDTGSHLSRAFVPGEPGQREALLDYLN
ncbi:MAG: hypothetical protein ACRETS_06230, partial [Steroidobacteraceae bacterium]